MKKTYYKRLDIVRVIACIAILLYHLNILKGGYLAVCTFFVMTGYLSVVSLAKHEEFSFKKYYINKFKKIYLPLLIVVFSSIAVISFFSNISWLNLKPETTSVFLGYNNFWQLNANLDYFVRHVSSPFMHLWYIAILLQFELIFPFIYFLFKKIENKASKLIPCILFFILGIGSFLFFVITINNGDIMPAYYGTFTRLFSLLFGVSLGYIHTHYHPLIFNNKIANRLSFIFYLIILCIIYYFMDVNFCSFNISMILATLVSIRLIDYSIYETERLNIFDKLIKFLSSISYEVYLIQYPVIFIFEYYNFNTYLEITLIILITLVLSYIINKSLNNKNKIIKIILCIVVSICSLFGVYKYIVSKDYTKEMNDLENKLNQNSILIEEQKKKFLEQKKNEEDEFKKLLDDLETSEEKLKDTVKNMSIVGVGDSIMELAVKELYKTFPNGYFDAKTNRSCLEINGIVKDLLNKNALGDVLVLNIGTNGGWSDQKNEELIKMVGDRKIFWLNATNPDFARFNGDLINFASKHDNVYIIDWISVIKEHPEYLIYDKVHPTVYGCKIYANTIYEAIYNEFLNELNKKKEEKIKEHEQKYNQSISFVGNELLLGMYNSLQESYNDSDFVIINKKDYSTFKKTIEEKINNNSLSHNIVLIPDYNSSITNKEYNEIISMLNNYNIIIVKLNNDNYDQKSNLITIDFSNEIVNNNYISFDGIHLTNEGNNKLKELIDNNLNK